MVNLHKVALKSGYKIIFQMPLLCCKDRNGEIERQRQREESFSNKCLRLEGQTAQQSTRLAGQSERAVRLTSVRQHVGFERN